MSKICKNCNAVIEDDSKFCIQCGSNEFIVNEAPQQYYVPAPKKKSNKLFAIIGGAVIVALVLVLLLVFVGGKPYQGAVDIMFEARYEGDTDDIDELVPEFVLEKKGMDIESLREKIEENWQSNESYLETRYGDDYEITMEILMEKELSERNLRKAAIYLETEYGIERDEVTEAYNVIYSITIEGSEDIYVVSNEIDVIKIDGDWYPVEFSAEYEVSFFA